MGILNFVGCDALGEASVHIHPASFPLLRLGHQRLQYLHLPYAFH